jgi:predicted metalloprotease with PDZ domain
MSPSSIKFVFITAILVVVSCVSVRAQNSTATISLTENSELRIQLKQEAPTDSWSFVNAYAGAVGLGERVKTFSAFHSNQPVTTKRIASGEYRSATTADTISYTIQIAPQRPGDLAHISWLTRDRGVLMLADLLPESFINQPAVLEFELPVGLSIESSFSPDARNTFVVDDPAKAMFLVGNVFDIQAKSHDGTSCRVVLSERWRFKSDDVLKSANKVIESYKQLTGTALNKSATILVASLPSSDSAAVWKAETRGNTVLLLLNPRAQVKNWIGQVGVILTHELFHLWVPNSLSFTGDYDWFFEGFTLYIALQTALKLKLINFQEYLDTLGRVYDSYLSYADEQSLIAASERRWTSAVPLVYDKGMLVAFIYDVASRLESDGANSLTDTYAKIFQQRAAGGPIDGNDVIIKALSSSPATKDIVKRYVEGPTRVELEKILPAFGLNINVDGPKSHLSVRKDLNDPQKHLIQSLGYRK